MNALSSEQNISKRKNDDTLFIPWRRWVRIPWWFVAIVILWIYVVISISSSPDYRRIYDELDDGIGLTIYLAVVSYLIALVIGLIVGLIRAYPPRILDHGAGWKRHLVSVLHTLVYNAATFYVEFMRGIPALVFLLIAGFIIVPALRGVINSEILPLLRSLLNNPEIPDLVWRGRDEGTAIAGLSLIYGAFLAEVFRAGIVSVPKGQVEAARSLGMTYLQTMRLIVVPQAIRTILPPLGNDFVAMIKDTSLVTILGTNEITQLARKWSGSSFQYLETYLVLSLIYLTMTVTGSILVQTMERRLKRHERR
ncbi:MAG: amino acid ABC transporter permease [Anaerolineae bacterium]|nr:amino acid ABC transporter permease [Anaerolineae bacterium]MDW8172909.1 amino acid ABC transporter permease [Anaerolineae bacterium]